MNTGIAEQTIIDIAELATGQSVHHVEFIFRGATSAAWRVQCGGDAFVIRAIPRGTHQPATYQSEFTLLRLLCTKGHPVPEPILNYVEAGADSLANIDVPWAVTRVIPGKAIKANALSRSVAIQLGQLLADLHRLPHTDYGRLQENAANIVGLQENPLAGIRARWCWSTLWPYDGSDLDQHPVAQLMPELVDKITPLAPALWEIANEDRVAVLHADLHGEHIFCADDRLAGVIDFGAAVIATPAWEFAVLGHYHGWTAVEMVLDGYTSDGAQQAQIYEQAQKLAVVIGLYKLARAVKASANREKVRRIMQFVIEILSVDMSA